jgi:DNA-binding GntR family transcriptional regulator
MAQSQEPVNINILLDFKSLKERVAEELRRAIVSGVYSPGMQLKQDVLAGQFGVSRMPIREALLQLEAEGLIEFRRYRVANVKTLSADDIREIFEIRMLLESRAVELGAPNLTDNHLAEMAECHKIMCSFKCWRPEWPAHNKKFHSTIYNAAGRSHMVHLIATVQTKLDRYLSLYLSRSDMLMKSNDEHAGILQACRERDATRAALLTRRHIEETMDALLRQVTGVSLKRLGKKAHGKIRPASDSGQSEIKGK